MGAKNLLRMDPYSDAVANPEYFYPLALRMEVSEKQKFIQYVNQTFQKQTAQGQELVSPAADVKKFFPLTHQNTNEFLKPLGIECRNFTLFVSGANGENLNPHVDGTRLPSGESVMLEARLSYYELASSPGVIRWWNVPVDDLVAYERESHGVYHNHWNVPWYQDLVEGRKTWADCPDFDFETASNVSSALLRTNRPHLVLQGPGRRITVSAQLVWSHTKSPQGVWQHIVDNFRLLGSQFG
jgi:hypothetical protein